MMYVIYVLVGLAGGVLMLVALTGAVSHVAMGANTPLIPSIVVTVMCIEKRKKIGFDYYQILAYLDYIKSLSCTSQVKRTALVTIFVNRIYLYDDFFTLILNGGNSNLTIENIPLKNIENTFCSPENGTLFSSSIDSSAPPKEKRTPCGCVSLLVWCLWQGESNDSNAAVRWTATCCGSQRRCTIIFFHLDSLPYF